MERKKGGMVETKREEKPPFWEFCNTFLISMGYVRVRFPYMGEIFASAAFICQRSGSWDGWIITTTF